MSALTFVILPVFLVIGLGYLAVWKLRFPAEGADMLMSFAQSYAIPVLLFMAMTRLDLALGFQLALLVPFYAGAFTGFLAGVFGARFLFRRDWEDAVVIGFCAAFSNSLLLGLPITERAYGADALTGNYAIIALHAPSLLTIGIVVMELVRARGAPLAALPKRVAKGVFSNGLIIGILSGLVVNITGLSLPQVLIDGADLVARAGLPAALFALGGVLVRYKPEGDLRIALFICALSLGLHPLITFTLGNAFGLGQDGLRSATITAAMAPGINTYIFAHMYSRAKRVAASAVLLATGLTMLTALGWLTLLP
ncbi:AEC family transporter [Vannielia sp.]|uniref:AEC family transporter n=1 Tax=Vannielia sp. TaxID=2813045 RepID=UPI00260ABC47|nr:AEC family transporter [Vannielia sp.]MDF1873027.1 AEC family transporter [Vannielia sp.]